MFFILSHNGEHVSYMVMLHSLSVCVCVCLTGVVLQLQGLHLGSVTGRSPMTSDLFLKPGSAGVERGAKVRRSAATFVNTMTLSNTAAK